MTIPTSTSAPTVEHIIASPDILESALEACQTVQRHLKALGISPVQTYEALVPQGDAATSDVTAKLCLKAILRIYCPGNTLRGVVIQILRAVYSQAATEGQAPNEHPDLGRLMLVEVKEGPDERVH